MIIWWSFRAFANISITSLFLICTNCSSSHVVMKFVSGYSELMKIVLTGEISIALNDSLTRKSKAVSPFPNYESISRNFCRIYGSHAVKLEIAQKASFMYFSRSCICYIISWFVLFSFYISILYSSYSVSWISMISRTNLWIYGACLTKLSINLSSLLNMIMPMRTHALFRIFSSILSWLTAKTILLFNMDSRGILLTINLVNWPF